MLPARNERWFRTLRAPNFSKWMRHLRNLIHIVLGNARAFVAQSTAWEVYFGYLQTQM